VTGGPRSPDLWGAERPSARLHSSERTVNERLVRLTPM
jgi:hypothetical protein